MKVGDLVIRKVPERGTGRRAEAKRQRRVLGHGLVLSTFMSGRPRHQCVTVYYSKVGRTYDIADSLMEVVSESR